MKNKVLVVLYVPLLEKEFDIFIPYVKKIGYVKKMMISIVVENSDGNFIDDGCKFLYDKSTGEKLDDNQYVKNSHIKNGTRLILF